MPLINFLFKPRSEMVFNATTTEDEFAKWIDQSCANQNRLLVDLLYERHIVYQGRTTNAMLRMRGYTMARFEQIGLPSKAFPYVLEALESSYDPYMVAAAAKALRGMKDPHPQTTGYLIKSFYNIWQHDQPISFSQYHIQWPLKTFSTALIEILTTIKWMGVYSQKYLEDLESILYDFGHHLNKTTYVLLTEVIEAVKTHDHAVDLDCCEMPLDIVYEGFDTVQYVNAKSFPNLILEDQQGEQFQWGDFFKGKPTLLAFFYTRCRNPRKCTLTIQKLASVQEKLKELKISGDIQVAAITYDPTHDSPNSLKTYGLSRKFQFDDNNKMFRVPHEFESVVSAFDLGVNFNETLVNQHRIELYLLDKDGAIKHSFLRLQSEIETIAKAVNGIHNSRETIEDGVSPFSRLLTRLRPKTNGFFSVFLSFLIAFFPKCPICWTVYLSAFGISSLQSIPYSPWLLPWIIVVMVLSLFFLYRNAKIRNGLAPFWISLFGFFLVGIGYLFSTQTTSILGIVLIFIGGVINSLSFRQWLKVNLKISKQISLVRIKIRKSKTEYNIVYKQ